MRTFVFVTLLAVALAEPDSYNLYNAAHNTAGFQAFPNGAVVPQDTDSVKHAKALHHSAKANAYASKGFMPYFAQQYAVPRQYAVPHVAVAQQYAAPHVAVAQQYAAPHVTVAQPQKVVQYKAPVVQAVQAAPVYHHAAVPFTHQQYAYPQFAGVPQMTYGHHAVYKREAEAEAEPEAEADSQVFGVNPYTSAYYGHHANVYGSNVYGAINPYYSAASAFYNPYTTTAYTAGHHVAPVYTTAYNRLFKRDAEAEPEAEADAHRYYGNSYYNGGHYGARPYSGAYYGNYNNGYYNNYNGYTGYNGWY